MRPADHLHTTPPGKPFPLASLLLAFIMAGGLLLRLVFFTASLPSRGFPFILDEGNYVDLAIPLSQGMGFVEKWVWLRPPGYPIYLAGMLVLSGGNLAAGALVQVLLSVLNIGVMYALAVEALARYPGVPIARRRAVGLVAAGLMALNPHVVFYANLFMVETPYMLAFSILAWLLLRALRDWEASPRMMPSRQVMALMAMAGVVAAFAILVRSLLFSFTPLLLAWFWWVLPRPEGAAKRLFPSRRWSLAALVPIGLFVAAMFAVILPWTVRNYLRYDRLLLIDTMAGYNLWQYNDKIGKDELVSRLAAIPNPADRDRYAMQQGQRAILADPSSFVRDAAERFGDSWSVEQFDELRVSIKNKYPGADCFFMDLYAWLETLFYVGLGLLALWGFVLAPGRTLKGLFLLVLFHYVATGMVTHVEFRYRIPIYPLATLYAAWMVVALPTIIQNPNTRKRVPEIQNHSTESASRRRKMAIAATGLLSLLFVGQSMLFALPGLADSLRFERRYLEGKSRIDSGDYAGALSSFEGAEQIDRSCACLYRNIGLAQGKLGRPDEERASYSTAIAREEHDWRTRALLSDRLRAAGDSRFAGPLRTTRPEFRVEQLRWAWENLSPQPRSEVDVGGDDLGYVMGFESFEAEAPSPGSAPVTYRWTTGNSRVRLAAPPGDGALKLRIRWHSLSWPGKPTPDAEVRVIVNGVEAGNLIAHPGWEDVALPLPASINTGPFTVELQTRAEKPPGPELRLLGVAVDQLKLER